jgi:hypothetical protein
MACQGQAMVTNDRPWCRKQKNKAWSFGPGLIFYQPLSSLFGNYQALGLNQVLRNKFYQVNA